MPPGSDVVYSVISGGVTLAKQVFDLVFAQTGHSFLLTGKSPPGGAEEAEDLEAGVDGRTMRRQDHRPSEALHLLRELGLEGVSGPGDRHRPSRRRSQLCRSARVRSDRVPG